jgi:hypothetical protein
MKTNLILVQSIYAVTDQLTSRRRLAVGHWWTAYPIPVLYAVLNVSYWAAGGQNEVKSCRNIIIIDNYYQFFLNI